MLKKRVILEDEIIEKDWKQTWKIVKSRLNKGLQEKRIARYTTKEMQSESYRKQENECHLWLKQKLEPRKTAAILTMLEQMVETRSWKVARGLSDNDKCRLCGEYKETVHHLLAGCKVLASGEYLSRHNRALMILATTWAKCYNLIEADTRWYRERWERGHVLENENAKLIWDFEFKMRKTTKARRPDLTLEDKITKKIWICDMACPQEINIEDKRVEKLNKYRQLAFEMRERRPGYKITVVPLIIGALGGGVKETSKYVEMVFGKEVEKSSKVLGEMQKTVLMDSESIIRKVISGLFQSQD